jgi:hypothetical protein
LGDSSLKKYTLKNFIGLAMVPVYISAALSLGMMIVLVVAKTDTTQQAASFGNDGYVQFTKEGEDEIIKVGRNPDAQIKLTVIGSPLGLANGAGKGKEVGAGTIGKLLVMVLALMILWLGVMAGAKASEFTAAAIEPIESFGKGVGGTLMKLPQYVPLVPTGDGKTKMSYAGFQSLGNQIGSIGDSARQSGSTFGQRIAGSVENTMGINSNQAGRAAQAKIDSNRMSLTTGTKEQAGESIAKIMQTYAQDASSDTVGKLALNNPARTKIAEAAGLLEGNRNLTDADKQKLKNAVANLRKGTLSEDDLKLALNDINIVLGGRLNLNGDVRTDSWNSANAGSSWTALGGGRATTPAATPTSTPSVTPVAFTLPAPAAGATAASIATDINAHFDSTKKRDPAYLAGLKSWIEVNVPAGTLRSNVINGLKTAGYDDSKLL